jgi:hypothetical protein
MESWGHAKRAKIFSAQQFLFLAASFNISSLFFPKIRSLLRPYFIVIISAIPISDKWSVIPHIWTRFLPPDQIGICTISIFFLSDTGLPDARGVNS